MAEAGANEVSNHVVLEGIFICSRRDQEDC